MRLMNLMIGSGSGKEQGQGQGIRYEDVGNTTGEVRIGFHYLKRFQEEISEVVVGSRK